MTLNVERHPLPNLFSDEHAEAVDWITANCIAVRRDNGDMDYSLGAMIAAYEAGKASQAAPLDESALGWNMAENLRWLSDQAGRPDYVPCGILTGMFLRRCADRLESLAVEKGA